MSKTVVESSQNEELEERFDRSACHWCFGRIASSFCVKPGSPLPADVGPFVVRWPRYQFIGHGLYLQRLVARDSSGHKSQSEQTHRFQTPNPRHSVIPLARCAALQNICESLASHMKTRKPCRWRSLPRPTKDSPRLPCDRGASVSPSLNRLNHLWQSDLVTSEKSNAEMVQVEGFQHPQWMRHISAIAECEVTLPCQFLQAALDLLAKTVVRRRVKFST